MKLMGNYYFFSLLALCISFSSFASQASEAEVFQEPDISAESLQKKRPLMCIVSHKPTEELFDDGVRMGEAQIITPCGPNCCYVTGAPSLDKKCATMHKWHTVLLVPVKENKTYTRE